MKVKYFFALLWIFSNSSADASSCLDAENFNDLLKEHDIVIVGTIKQKKATTDSGGNVKIEVVVKKVIKGSLNIKRFDGYTMEYWLEEEKPMYKVGRSYAFPIIYDKKRKKSDLYRILVPPQGCNLFPQD